MSAVEQINAYCHLLSFFLSLLRIAGFSTSKLIFWVTLMKKIEIGMGGREGVNFFFFFSFSGGGSILSTLRLIKLRICIQIC